MTERDDVKPEPSAEEIERVAWPPLKKALWGVVTGEALNGGRYVNAYDLTDKLHAAILALDSRASPPAQAVAVPEGWRPLVQQAIDLLTERKHGNPARSPGHNARLMLQDALAAAPTPPAAEAPGQEPYGWIAPSGRSIGPEKGWVVLNGREEWSNATIPVFLTPPASAEAEDAARSIAKMIIEWFAGPRPNNEDQITALISKRLSRFASPAPKGET